MASSNVLDLCRLCGTDTLSIVRHNIFDDEGQMKKFAEKISNCLPVNVTEEDPLPKIMCGECAYKLDFLSEFREKSVKTESVLMALIKKNIKHEVIDTEEQNEGRVILSSTRHSTRRAAKTRYFVESESEDATHQTDDDFHGDDSYRDDEDEDSEIAEPPKKKERRSLRTRTPRKKKKSLQEEAIPENEENAEECSLCGLQVPDIVAHNRELHAHLLNCPKCPQVYESQRALNKHTEECHDSNEDLRSQNFPILCTKCPKRFSSRTTMNAHARRVHGGKRKEMSLLCKYCGRAFSRKQYLVDHERKHRNERPFKCTTCEKGFYSKVLLKSHLRVHTVSDYKYECDLCHMQFTTQTGCRAHRKRHFEENRRFECLACGLRFFKRATLDSHQVSKHTHIKPFECAICAKRFPCKYDLQKHIETHLKIKSQVCEFCGAAYFRSDHLRRHKMLQHKELVPSYRSTQDVKNFDVETNDGPPVALTANQEKKAIKPKYLCKICKKEFSKKFSKEKHENRPHTVLCGSCNALFAADRDRAIHKCFRSFSEPNIGKDGNNTTSNCHVKMKNKSLTCPQCQKTYSSPANLQRHIDIPHIHPCKVCNISFATNRQWMAHNCKPTPRPEESLPSTSKFKYQCYKCNKRFVQAPYYNEHMSKPHNHFCKTCKRYFVSDRERIGHSCLYKCPHCKFSAKAHSMLQSHIENYHENGLEFECDICKDRFMSKRSVVCHIISRGINHSSSVGKKKSDVEKECSSEASASNPKTESEKPKYLCKICLKEFSKKFNQEKHESRAHSVLCVSCNALFASDRDRSRHTCYCSFSEPYISKDGFNDSPTVKNKSLECEQCHKTYSSHANLMRHVVVPHIHRCKVCNVSFATIRQRTAHNCKPVPKPEATHPDTSKYKFQCGMCNKRFVQESYYNEHMSKTHNHYCKTCKLYFVSARDRSDHSCLFKCLHCNYSSKTHSKLQTHIENIHENKIEYECDICKERFLSKRSVASHIIARGIDHRNPLKILDLACQELLVKQQKRVSSRKTKQRNPEPEPPADPMKIEVLDVRSLPHFSAEPSLQPDKIEEFNNPITSRADFTCAQCHIKFKNYGSYVAHSKKPHKHHCKACNKNFINARGEHACAFKCDQCDFRYFKTNHHLKSHIKKFHSGLEFICNDCGTKCPTKLLMKVHYVKVHIKKHTEDHRFKATWCHECKRSFSSTFVLQHHKLRVHDGLILCCFCLATFPSKEERKKHVKEVHESKKDKPHFDCPECGKQLSSRAMVQIHVDNIHKKLRPHLCQVCGSSFALASHLKLHIMMHTGEKKHVCEVCGHAFARIENLTQHKRIHSDVRPYHCDFCSMKFKQASSLKSHRRIHTGERPYKCNLCPSSFRCKPQLNRHVKFHPA